MNGPHKYGSAPAYGSMGHFYGEVAESFAEESPLPPTVFTGQFLPFGSGLFGAGGFGGTQVFSLIFTSESAFIPTYTKEA